MSDKEVSDEQLFKKIQALRKHMKYSNEYNKKFDLTIRGDELIVFTADETALSYKAKAVDIDSVRKDAVAVTKGKMSWQEFYKKWEFSS